MSSGSSSSRPEAVPLFPPPDARVAGHPRRCQFPQPRREEAPLSVRVPPFIGALWPGWGQVSFQETPGRKNEELAGGGRAPPPSRCTAVCCGAAGVRVGLSPNCLPSCGPSPLLRLGAGWLQSGCSKERSALLGSAPYCSLRANGSVRSFTPLHVPVFICSVNIY